MRKAGITSIGKLRHAGFLRPAIPAWTEVFVNDQVQTLSRWPNDTSALMGKVIETGSIPRVEDFSNKGGTFEYYGDRPSRWKSGDPKWIAGYFAHGYADDMVQIANSAWDMYNYSNIRVVNANYLKCTNISLTYMFPEDILSKWHLQRLELSLSATNLFTIASPDLKGQTPTQGGFTDIQLSERPTFSLGLNVSF